MPVGREYHLVLGEAPEEVRVPPRKERQVARASPVKVTLEAQAVVRALKATTGAQELIDRIPGLVKAQLWSPVASFSVCHKTGTATFLDIWNAAHLDQFTDMQHCLTDCRAWFSADGFTYWDSPQTKNGRINCYFRAPSAGHFVCNVQLQSHGGPARVECLIDSFNFGPLPFNGSINQPHPCSLGAGYHSFRIRQVSGSFFFIGLTVWRV